MPLLGFVAGEASGDGVAAPVFAALLKEMPHLATLGVGGERLAAAGANVAWGYGPLAVHGFSDALARLPSLIAFRRRLRQTLLAHRISHFLGIDAPDFNLGLARALNRAGVRTAQLVSPSVWAWRRGRIPRVVAAVERLFCLFPFEPACYAGTGLCADYVGHPLADAIPLVPDRDAARAALAISPSAPVLAILPGSRAGEWRRLAATFFAAAERVAAAVPGLVVVVPTADDQADQWVIPFREAWSGRAPLIVAPRAAHQALAAADVVLVASGTATLEAALFKRPMVIAYRVPSWQYRLMRQMAYLPWVGLPNILLNDSVVPELLQKEATPAKLAAALLAWWEAPARVAALADRFAALHETLRCQMAERTAALLAEWIIG